MGIRLQSGEAEAAGKTSETLECNVKMDLKSAREKKVVDWNDLAEGRNI
jgi:hypothetical protein